MAKHLRIVCIGSVPRSWYEDIDLEGGLCCTMR